MTTAAAGAADIEVRIVRDEDSEEWQRALSNGFLSPARTGEAAAEWWRPRFAPGRILGAFDGARCVGTFHSLEFALTVPGGATLPVDGVAGVTVATSHRRRGILRRMMELDLERARERGDVFALLNAAQYGIYGRFGFGPAIRYTGVEIEVARSRGPRPGVGELPVGAAIEPLTMAELVKAGPDLYDRFRVRQPGAISRSPLWWALETGQAEPSAGGRATEPIAVAYRDPGGRITGLLTYRADNAFSGGDPHTTVTVVDHFALDRTAEAALWRHALSIEWAGRLVVPHLAPDDPLPRLLVNPRAALPLRRSHEDHWLRVLDAPRAFAARTYEAPGRTVFEVADAQGYVAGRWSLETAADGTGVLTRTDDPAELALDAGALSSVYLGDATVPHLEAAGLITELTPGAAHRAGLQLRTSFAPWCPVTF
ncbi:GNAT family N-acetyltransferase [Streptomyces radicis]|uniref:GNAT family N-acetyltransferase n=1 Tax=Streptomyces radicis TaxID=1750517 RepID=A0A3A9VWW5_9ACTN|nr:GNAT family N-acetyltransferase [Streptomyces radicis]RKN05240.1 GNAT family N-acetyltransferase [Streptomyces radicis]RKN16773.1 GNAT family N-acetyltransferase [Streptomyces radicis]